MEPKPGVTLVGGAGQIAKLSGGERQRTQSFAVIHRGTPGGGEGLRGVTVAVESVGGSAAAVVVGAEGADLEGRGARR